MLRSLRYPSTIVVLGSSRAPVMSVVGLWCGSSCSFVPVGSVRKLCIFGTRLRRGRYLKVYDGSGDSCFGFFRRARCVFVVRLFFWDCWTAYESFFLLFNRSFRDEDIARLSDGNFVRDIFPRAEQELWTVTVLEQKDFSCVRFEALRRDFPPFPEGCLEAGETRQ